MFDDSKVRKILDDPVPSIDRTSSLYEQYAKLAMGHDLADLHVARVYQSGGGMARFFRQLKSRRENFSDISLGVLMQLWSPALASILGSLHADQRIAIATAPSSGAIARISSTIVTEFLERRGYLVAPLAGTLEKRVDVNLKNIKNWRLREVYEDQLVSGSCACTEETVLLIDDVIASGTTLRACAQAIQAERSVKVIGLVTSADLPGFRAQYANTCPSSKLDQSGEYAK